MRTKKALRPRTKKRALRRAQRAQTAQSRYLSLGIELLESRRVLAAFTWSGDGTGDDWDDPANWDGPANKYPGEDPNADTVTFPSEAGSYDVDLNVDVQGNNALASITVEDGAELDLDIENNTLVVTQSVDVERNTDFTIHGAGTLTATGTTTTVGEITGSGAINFERGATANFSTLNIDYGSLTMEKGTGDGPTVSASTLRVGKHGLSNVSVTNLGSELSGTTLEIGSGARGLVQVTDEAKLDMTLVYVGNTLTSNPDLDDGTLNIFDEGEAEIGQLFVGFGAEGEVTVRDDGHLEVTTRAKIGDSQPGALNVGVATKGTAEIERLDIAPRAQGDVFVNGNGSTLTVNGITDIAPSTHKGVLETRHAQATVDLKGSVTLGEEAEAGGIGNWKFTQDLLSINNGAKWRPGRSPGELTLEGDIAFGDDATLEIEIGGEDAGDDYDVLKIIDGTSADGDATLDGTLDVSLINSFSPSAGDEFDILEAESITGTFNNLPGGILPENTSYLPSLDAGLQWKIEYGDLDSNSSTPEVVRLSVVPQVSLAGPASSVREGSGDTADFTVTLSEASSKTVKVVLETSDITATGTGYPFTGDYADSSGTLTFQAGQTVKTLPILVVDDTISESDETFQVDILSADGAAINPNADSDTAVITDDALVLLVGPDDPIREASGDKAQFSVTLAEPTDHVVTVILKTNDITATGTGYPFTGDYASVSGTLTFAAGNVQPNAALPGILVVDDTIDEADETFEVEIEQVTGGDAQDLTATAVITDDALVQMAGPGAPILEGPGATASFTVTLAEPTDHVVTVVLQTNDGTATGTGYPFTGDYASVSGTLVFAVGAVVPTVALPGIQVIDDTIGEADETFTLDINSVTGGDVASGNDSRVATIEDDDGGAPLLLGEPSDNTPANLGTIQSVSRDIIDTAVGYWAERGYDSTAIEALRETPVYVTNLRDGMLGLASTSVWIDQDAAGRGWSTADLQHTVIHEFGHKLGLPDLNAAGSIMSASLELSRHSSAVYVDRAFSMPTNGSSHLSSTISLELIGNRGLFYRADTSGAILSSYREATIPASNLADRLFTANSANRVDRLTHFDRQVDRVFDRFELLNDEGNHEEELALFLDDWTESGELLDILEDLQDESITLHESSSDGPDRLLARLDPADSSIPGDHQLLTNEEISTEPERIASNRSEANSEQPQESTPSSE